MGDDPLVRNLMPQSAAVAGISPLDLSMTDSRRAFVAFKGLPVPQKGMGFEGNLCRTSRKVELTGPDGGDATLGVVKRKMSNFKLKRANDRSSTIHLEVSFVDRQAS